MAALCVVPIIKLSDNSVWALTTKPSLIVEVFTRLFNFAYGLLWMSIAPVVIRTEQQMRNQGIKISIQCGDNVIYNAGDAGGDFLAFYVWEKGYFGKKKISQRRNGPDFSGTIYIIRLSHN